MRTYADTSFILRLVTGEADSPATIAEYRRLGSPRLFYGPIHALETRTAILQRAFHQRHALSGSERQHVSRERDMALARLDRLLAKRALLDVSLNLEAAIERAVNLSAAHTERLGARAIDLLHVATALVLATELFLTSDERQAQVAKSEGLEVNCILP